MIHEINIYGVFVSPMLIWTLIALVITALLRRAIGEFGLYRFVWHRPLFDLSLLVIVLGGVAAISLRGGTP
jgi:protein AaeX